MTPNLSFLEQAPNINTMALLEVEPLAPLSMVSDLPGSYYKTLRSPSKKMLCGLFENILGWHIDESDRAKLIKTIKKIRKKQKKEFPITDGSSYQPLIMEYFDIELGMLPPLNHFDDYWSKAFRRPDETSHPRGTFNISYEIIHEKKRLPRDAKKPNQIDIKALKNFFLKNISKYPYYYSTPTKREFIDVEGSYRIKLAMDGVLFHTLQNTLLTTNNGYLGTSEGWVDIKLNAI